VWLDGAIHFCTGFAEQKAINLRVNPHVILTTGCNQWDAGLDVIVEGDAVQVTDDDTLTRLAAAWARKWDGRWRYLVRDGRFHHHDEDGVLPEKILVSRSSRPRSSRLQRAVSVTRVTDSDSGTPWLARAAKGETVARGETVGLRAIPCLSV